MRVFLRVLTLSGIVAMATAAHADCGSDSSDEAVKNCLAQDLRDSDKRINAVYQLLMGSLDDAGKLALRDEQRAWLKARDKACVLNNKESNRDKWLEAILANQDKTVCVVRYTFARVGQLDLQLKQKAPNKTADAPAAPQAPLFAPAASNGTAEPSLPVNLIFLDDGYKAMTANTHERGKWYYEVWIDRGRLASMGDLLITPGFSSQKSNVVRMVNVRHTQAGMGSVLVGLALDLDNGFAYLRQDGQWRVAPGVVGGIPVLLNSTYGGAIGGSSEIRELVKRGLVKVNLGERPFGNPAPENYRAWGEN